MKDKISKITDRILPDIIKIRQHLHQHPELAGKEFATAAFIKEALNDTSIKISPPFLETDVVGILTGGKGDGANVTLRADIDALPLEEENDLPYKSKTPGVMHACGHDGHTAILIGAAKVLSEIQSELRGTVRFVFQPGEEVVALGKALVEAGALENPEPDAVFALHAENHLPVGTIGLKPGPIMAAADFFKLTITGKGAHGSRPHVSVDPILTGAKIVEGLQSITSRRINPQKAVVVSVCRFSSGTNGNVIPEKAILEGTTRYLDKNTGDQLPKLMEQIIDGACAMTGATYEFEYLKSYIPTVNTPELIPFAENVVKRYLGENSVKSLQNSSMGGEDFSYYLDRYPGVYAKLGIGSQSPSIHNPEFDFNDDSLKAGILYFTGLAVDYMDQHWQTFVKQS